MFTRQEAFSPLHLTRQLKAPVLSDAESPELLCDWEAALSPELTRWLKTLFSGPRGFHFRLATFRLCRLVDGGPLKHFGTWVLCRLTVLYDWPPVFATQGPLGLGASPPAAANLRGLVPAQSGSCRIRVLGPLAGHSLRTRARLRRAPCPSCLEGPLASVACALSPRGRMPPARW